MKNNFKILITIFFIYFSIINANALEDFKFESKSIEIKDNNNIIAREGVSVITSDGLEILAEEKQ